jgi:hypothetical protein
MGLPTELPSIVNAKLPAAYQQAKQALAECERVDECKTWADKMAALASYGRQAHDDSLVKHAMRIQNRAWRRAGELLEEFDARPQNAIRDEEQKAGDHHLISRAEAGAAARMSAHQVKTAVRVARIPADEFEAAVESDDPPTVTKLAEMGKKVRPVKIIDHTEGRDPKEFNLAIHAFGDLRRHAESVRDIDVAAVVRGSFPEDSVTALMHIESLGAWLAGLKRELEKVYGVQWKRSPDRGSQADRQAN